MLGFNYYLSHSVVKLNNIESKNSTDTDIISLVDRNSYFELTKPNVPKYVTLYMMTTNGERIRDYLENVTYELSLGCTYHSHKYSQSESNSCLICGKSEQD